MATTLIALIRGINVGPSKRVAMADLRELLTGLGYADVRTYLQSGNAVFSTGAVAATVAASRQSAARTPGTLFAAIEAPVPVQQHTTACSARPSATSRAAVSEAHAHPAGSPGASAPCAHT